MLTSYVYLSVYFQLKRSYLRAAFGKKLEPKLTSFSKVKAKIYSNLLLFELKVLLNLFAEQTRWVLIVTTVFTTKVSFHFICAIQHNVVYKPVLFKFGHHFNKKGNSLYQGNPKVCFPKFEGIVYFTSNKQLYLLNLSVPANCKLWKV